jgi:hypothetical protein
MVADGWLKPPPRKIDTDIDNTWTGSPNLKVRLLTKPITLTISNE